MHWQERLINNVTVTSVFRSRSSVLRKCPKTLQTIPENYHLCNQNKTIMNINITDYNNNSCIYDLKYLYWRFARQMSLQTPTNLTLTVVSWKNNFQHILYLRHIQRMYLVYNIYVTAILILIIKCPSKTVKLLVCLKASASEKVWNVSSAILIIRDNIDDKYIINIYKYYRIYKQRNAIGFVCKCLLVFIEF